MVVKSLRQKSSPWLPLLPALLAGIFARRISGALAVGTWSALSAVGAPSAIAQSTITPTEITQYAQAVLAMDRYRNEAYTEIKNLLLTVNMDFSQIDASCSSSQNISNVPRSVRRQVREILVAYCNQAKEIVEASGLTPRRFNDITETHNTDPVLYERIQQELIRLQQRQ